DGNILVVALTSSFPTTAYRCMIIKVSPAGNFIWSKVYGRPLASFTTWDMAFGIAEDTRGDIYLSGRTEILTNNQPGNVNLYLMKFDSSGKVLWGRAYHKYFREGLASLVLRGDEIYATGWVLDADPGNSQSIYQAKFDTSGNIKWVYSYGTAGNATTNNISNYIVTRAGNPVFVGGANEAGAGNYDIYLFRSDSAGIIGSCNSYKHSPEKINLNPVSYAHSLSKSSITIGTGNGAMSKNVATISEKYLCEPLKANFSYVNACEGTPNDLSQSTTFSDASTNSPTSWSWNFGDPASGSDNTSATQNPSHIFDTAGTYIVKLISTNGIQTDTVSKTVVIYPQPFAGFTASRNPDGSFQFEADSAYSNTNYLWDFGDSSVGTGRTVVHSYDTGSYFVTLVVRTEHGCSSIDTTTINTGPSGIYVPGIALKNIKFYPNPATEYMTMSLDAPLSQPLQIVIYDVMGRKSGNYTLPAGGTALQLNVANMTAGQYLLHYSSEKYIGHINFVITE
ncbi:MAG: PKD domain-containing protein, partial [Bacteroidota bacterium]|nr:PKD domain-containing protein [Bacteroidota bacterium]